MAGATLPRIPFSRGITNRVQFLIDLLRAELVPHRRRIETAVRMAVIGTVGAGLMAACHIHSVLGTYVVWILVGSGGPMMSFASAITYAVACAIVLSLSVPLAAILSETPWLLLPFIGGVVAILTYAVPTRRFGGIALVLKVIFLDTFYNIVFHPGEFASDTASTYGGIALALATVAAFDNWLWPHPGEAMLLESMAEWLRATRTRMLSVTDAYLEEPGTTLPGFPALSPMAHHLELLDRAVKEGITRFRGAVLLASIVRAERLHDAVDRMVIVTDERVPHEARAMVRRELHDAVAAIAAALEELAIEVTHEISIGPDLPPSPAAARVAPVMQRLEAAILAARPIYLARAGGDEVINLGAFTAELARMAELVGRRLDHPPESETREPRSTLFDWQGYDSSLARYSLKVGLAVVIGYGVGVTSHHDNLSVILTTVIVAGLPTYGASLRKMILRLSGNTVGAGLAILAIIVITPNFETLPVYMMVFFLIFLIGGYAAQSSGRIAYAGNQIGTAFVLTFAGLGPTATIDGPLYRLLGILLGATVVTLVFVALWPEYASESMLPRLRKVFADTLELMPITEVTSSLTKIDSVVGEISRTMFELMGVVDDARMEGARSRIDPRAAVDATGTMRRIAHRFARIDAERLKRPLPPLSDESARLYQEFISRIRMRGTGWLEFLSKEDWLKAGRASEVAAKHSPEDLSRPLADLNQRVSANQFAELASWTLEQRRTFLGELQSFRRIAELSDELDQHLSFVPRERK